MTNPLKAIFKPRAAPTNALNGGFNFFFGRTAAGKVVNEISALQNTAVYACVRILAEAVAGLPLHLYRYNDDGGKEKCYDHPLYYLLHDAPNLEMPSFVFRETLMSHILLYGNAYAQIQRDGRGRVLGLYPLQPNRVTVDRDDKGNLFYTYKPDFGANVKSGGNDSEKILRRDEVLHIPSLGFDGIMGASPVALAKQAIGAAIAVEEYGSAFFANGASPGGVLEHPGTISNIDRLKESWHSQFTGANAHNIAILEEGLQYKQIGVSPEQAQFLQTRRFSINEICRVFKVPPHMVGDLEKSSFSNIEQQSLEFVIYSLSPWVTRFEQCMNLSLLLPSERGKYFVKFNVDGLLRGDYESRMRGYATARQNGWLSANNIRELENLNLIPAEEGGDKFLVNGNMKEMSNNGESRPEEVQLNAIRQILEFYNDGERRERASN